MSKGCEELADSSWIGWFRIGIDAMQWLWFRYLKHPETVNLRSCQYRRVKSFTISQMRTVRCWNRNSYIETQSCRKIYSTMVRIWEYQSSWDQLEYWDSLLIRKSIRFFDPRYRLGTVVVTTSSPRGATLHGFGHFHGIECNMNFYQFNAVDDLTSLILPSEIPQNQWYTMVIYHESDGDGTSPRVNTRKKRLLMNRGWVLGTKFWLGEGTLKTGWLVVWLPSILFSHILGIIIPID